LTKLGIIRCQERSEICPGYNCFPAIRAKTGSFAAYDDVELIGFDTCGGCGQGKSVKIIARAQRLKDKGAEVIHLSTCLAMHCPWKDLYAKDIKEKVAVFVVEKTHGPISSAADH